jgi:hypothetical protein
LNLRTILRLLWLGWLILLLGSFAANATGDTWWQAARLDMRMLSCLLLALAGWTAWWQLRCTRFAIATAWIALGMTLGFYGDSHVAERLWWPPFPHPIIGGIVFFGLGHLAYIAGCLSFRRLHQIDFDRRWWISVTLWELLGFLAWGSMALTTVEHSNLRIPTLLYTLLVAATPGFAMALAWHQYRYAALALGAILFFASDILLARNLFHGAFQGIDELTWTCYGGGQMLIVYGALWARRGDELPDES